jgi:E3 ubiquitin-protein ligase MARCH6
VVTVWLGFLPYVIRQVWRLLFWFSDGGWPSNYNLPGANHNTTSKEALEMIRELQQLASITSNGTSPVSPLQASQTSSASVSGVMSRLTGLLRPLALTLNSSIPDPLAASLFKSILHGFGNQGSESPIINNTTASQPPTGLSSSSSLLSEVSFLRNLTRSSHVNQLVITVAEGYVITIVVVICFILVFLIREWVVQQQPGINMGAGFNAEFAAPERPRDQAAQEREQDLAARPGPGANLLGNRPERREAGPRAMAHPRRRHPRPEDGAEPRRRHADALQRRDQELPAEAGASNQRPSAVRDALSPAAEIQRQLQEPDEFMAIWRRANNNPEEVLRIIERENKGEQMRHWVNAMKILQSPAQTPRGQGFFTPSHSDQPVSQAETNARPLSDPAGPGPSSIDRLMGADPESDRSSASSDGWVDVSQPLGTRNPNLLLPHHQPENQLQLLNHSSNKGKGKVIAVLSPANSHLPGPENVSPFSRPDKTDSTTMETHDPESSRPMPTDDFNPWSTLSTQKPFVASRPRAVSDGPQPGDTISPLANNNWTFTDIPESVSQDTPNFSSHMEIRDFDRNTRTLYPPQSDGLLDARTIRDQDDIPEGNEFQDAATRSESGSESIDLNSDLQGPITILGSDGISRTYANWDEVRANEKDFDVAEEPTAERPEPTPFQPDEPLPEAREPVLARQPQPQGLLANLADFLWGGVGEVRLEEQGANDEHVVHDLAAEAPFVPVHNGPREDDADINEQDREVVEAAIAAGIDPNDQDAIDDAEDFEGIMELVGMRGPLFSLVQNALFSAFLLALTVAFGAWIPYNIGRVSLLLLANPGPAFKLPLRLIFGCAAFLQDLALSLAGAISYCLIALLSLPLTLWSHLTSSASSSLAMQGLSLGSAALRVSRSALDRIMDGVVKNLIYFTDSEILPFSAASHEALITLQSLLVDSISGLGSRVIYVFVGDYRVTMGDCYTSATEALKLLWHMTQAVPAFVARPDSWVISLALGKRVTPLDLELSAWSSADRFWATVAGYTAISVLGALYVRKGSPFSASQVGREWEATIIDLLNQAGGVMKVILIISIEMLVFPLYCGLLLDAALLPLFENTTIMSRFLFTLKSPLTSIFVHWFVGTCYMFHFALFVSMCRKIMRKGVLCK